MKTLIDQVKEADEKMTKAPWTADYNGGNFVWPEGTIDTDSIIKVYTNNRETDRDGIALYRTAAPILARNLKKAMKALERVKSYSYVGSAIPFIDTTIAEIQKEIEPK